MRSAVLIAFFASIVFAQPVLRTEMRNGIERACLLHAKSGEPVSDDAPALPGETVSVEGEGLV